ncbi:SoxR reducing system RseC family protein [Paraglaciecola sp. 2405UD69-4]|uniref:SoxR reducing system RseC family protein n=1 Tax=Paraglaciecola sp. 2405UD69-4 TaxID=3391836 RepID=UPI0039C9B2E4
MIEEIGTVNDIKRHDSKQFVWVETQVKSTCSSCGSQSNCGTGSIAKAFSRKKELLQFEFNESVAIGQKVKLGITEQSVLKASFIVYVIPMFAMISSAVLAQYLLPILGEDAEILTILFTFFCTFISFVSVKKYLKRNDDEKFHPHIISVLPLDQERIDVKQVQ